MITNERQRRAAAEKLRALEDSVDSLVDQLERRVYEALAEEVRSEIDEYDEVVSGRVQCFNVRNADDLGSSLIKARLSRKWSQTKLAAELDVSPQMIQKDESREFENCGLARFAEILDVLGFELVGAVRPKAGLDSTLPPDRSSLTTSATVKPVSVGVVKPLMPTTAGAPSNIDTFANALFVR